MSNEARADHGDAGGAELDHKTYSIHIDRQPFKIEADTRTGAQLRSLPTPPVPANRDLFRVVPGGLDVLVSDGDVEEMREGLHFITAPRDVTPGAAGGR